MGYFVVRQTLFWTPGSGSWIDTPSGNPHRHLQLLVIYRHRRFSGKNTRTPNLPQYSRLAYPANRSLQQHGRSNHRNDDDNGSDNQPVSPPRPCLRRLIALVLRLACRSLGGPSGFFFLLGFLKFSHGLPLCYGAVVVGDSCRLRPA